MDDSIKNFKNSEGISKQIKIGKRKLCCPFCGNNMFWTRESLLNIRLETLLDMDSASKGALNYICNDCGYIMWFLPKKALGI